MGCADDGSPLMEACKRDSRETAGRGDPAGKKPNTKKQVWEILFALPADDRRQAALCADLVYRSKIGLPPADEISGRRNQRSPKSFSWETMQGFKTLITLYVERAETV